MQNGIPYWYFHSHGGALAGTRLVSVDPDGSIGTPIPADRVIGNVVYPAAELVEYGVIQHIEGNRFPLGEPDGSSSERVQRVSECFVRAGLKAPVLEDIRSEIWLKLWGNLCFNPISALAHATLAGICRYPATRELAGWESVQSYTEIEADGARLILCHYPFRSWRGMRKGSVNLHGHSHGRLKPLPRQFDVGVDVWGFRPVTLSEILHSRR